MRADISLRKLCSTGDIADGEAKGFTLRDGDRLTKILIVRRGETFHGYLNRCPHEGIPLDWTPGRFLTPRKDYLLCQIHGALFEIDDGFCIDGPCAGDSLTPVAVSVEAGEVLVAL